MFLSPAFTFSLGLASFYGLLAHLIIGGDLRMLLVFVFASWVGFGIGQGVGQVMGIRVLAIGQINMVATTMGSLVALGTTAFLAIGTLPRLHNQ